MSGPAQREERLAPPRSKRIAAPKRPKWHGEIAAFGIWLFGTALARTWRTEFIDEGGLMNGSSDGPLIGAIWHNRLASAMRVWKWGGARRPGNGLAALISASRDGGLLARTFEYFGVRPVRGSSSRRGAQALLELTSAIEDGFHVAITPDGPRGPKYVVQPGIISLAQLTGRPILPVGVNAGRKYQFKSWDAFQVPLPFTTIQARFGPAIHVARNATDSQREAARAELERTLRALNRD